MKVIVVLDGKKYNKHLLPDDTVKIDGIVYNTNKASDTKGVFYFCTSVVKTK